MFSRISAPIHLIHHSHKGVINATGPFTDSLLSLDNPSHKPIVQPSSGIHITLPNYYSPRTMGLLDPATSDGRVIFFLPWQGNTIAGTTDTPADVEAEPKAPEEEIRWILEEVRRYLSPDIKVRRGDVLSAWSGLRPLVRNPSAATTEGLVRSHMVYVSESGLLTIAGGKWTTYRAMAEETVNEAVNAFGLEGKVTNGCVTQRVRLIGSDGWCRNMFIGLTQRVCPPTVCFVESRMTVTYPVRSVDRRCETSGGELWGSSLDSLLVGRADWAIVAIAWNSVGSAVSMYVRGNYVFLVMFLTHDVSQVIEAEVRYAVRHEYAQTAVDVIARRCRLSFLNVQAALGALPRVVEIMAEDLGWNHSRQRAEIDRATKFLASMGLPPGTDPPPLKTRSFMEKFRAVVGFAPQGSSLARTLRAGQEMVYSRAQFEAGEITALQNAFTARVQQYPAVEGETHLGRADVISLIKSLNGYEGVSQKDYEYVLAETGFVDKSDFNLDEFVEVRGTQLS